jgi:peroxiredoxin
MTAAHEDSVNQLLQNLHAERVATWRPEDLQVNIDQRRRLVDGADVDGFVKVGDVLEPFSVPAVDGSIVELDKLLASGPVVVIFFRFAGCPACNIALPYYQRRLYPELRKLGATLLTLSPQIPDKLLAIKEPHNLEFLVASDLNNELGARFGILYTFDEPSKAAALSRGSAIGDVTGTGTWELPMPTAIVIDGSRVARFVEVSPDWLVRTEAEPLIEVVRGLKAAGAELNPAAQAVA